MYYFVIFIIFIFWTRESGHTVWWLAVGCWRLVVNGHFFDGQRPSGVPDVVFLSRRGLGSKRGVCIRLPSACATAGDAQGVCGNLLECFAFGLFNGLRAGGGIGDLLPERRYTLRTLFDFAYFLIIVVIILNIVFGIIIDTFAQVSAFGGGGGRGRVSQPSSPLEVVEI